MSKTPRLKPTTINHNLNGTTYQFFVADRLQRSQNTWKAYQGKLELGCIEFTSPQLPNKLRLAITQNLADLTQINMVTRMTQKDRNASGYSSIEDTYDWQAGSQLTPYQKLLETVVDDLQLILDEVIGLPVHQAIIELMERLGHWTHQHKKDGITVTLDTTVPTKE